MINELKKYPKTFEKFEEYMRKFNYGHFTFTPKLIEFDMDYGDMDIPQQFLIGCLIEFLEENNFIAQLNYKYWDSELYDSENSPELICEGTVKTVLDVAFRRMEEKE